MDAPLDLKVLVGGPVQDLRVGQVEVPLVSRKADLVKDAQDLLLQVGGHLQDTVGLVYDHQVAGEVDQGEDIQDIQDLLVLVGGQVQGQQAGQASVLKVRRGVDSDIDLLIPVGVRGRVQDRVEGQECDLLVVS